MEGGNGHLLRSTWRSMMRLADHILLAACIAPHAVVAMWMGLVAVVSLTNGLLSGDWELPLSWPRGYDEWAGVAAVLAWAPVTVGAVVRWRGGLARAWLIYGPWPVTLVGTFLFVLVPEGLAILLPLWALAACSVIAGRRDQVAHDAMPDLPARV